MSHLLKRSSIENFTFSAVASNIIIHGLSRLFLRTYSNDTTDPLYFWALHVPAYSQKGDKCKKYSLLHSPLRAICTCVFTILPFTCFTYALQITKNTRIQILIFIVNLIELSIFHVKLRNIKFHHIAIVSNLQSAVFAW